MFGITYQLVEKNSQFLQTGSLYNFLSGPWPNPVTTFLQIYLGLPNEINTIRGVSSVKIPYDRDVTINVDVEVILTENNIRDIIPAKY